MKYLTNVCVYEESHQTSSHDVSYYTLGEIIYRARLLQEAPPTFPALRHEEEKWRSRALIMGNIDVITIE